MQTVIPIELSNDKTSFIKDNEKMIYSIMKTNFPNYKDKDDLYQVGAIGMCQAYDNYEIGYNTKPTTYAYPYAFGEMNKLVTGDRSIKVSRDYLKLAKSIEKTRVALAQNFMKEPTNKEIALFLKIDESLINEVEMALNYVDSLDRPVSIDGDNDYYNIVGNNYQLDNLDKLFLYEQLETLDDIEKIIIEKRYFNDETQQEIADELGVNQVQVSRILKRALIKMRDSY